MVVHTELRETWWCDLRFLLSPFHPSLLLSHNLTMGLRPETLPPSSVPLLREHSFRQCRPCPVYEVIIGYHIPDHPRWAFNNPGFESLMLFETYSESNNPLDSVKKNIQNEL